MLFSLIYSISYRQKRLRFFTFNYCLQIMMTLEEYLHLFIYDTANPFAALPKTKEKEEQLIERLTARYYHSYLPTERDKNYFEPIYPSHQEKIPSGTYYREYISIKPFIDIITPTQYLYLCYPSFESPALLIMDKGIDSVTLTYILYCEKYVFENYLDYLNEETATDEYLFKGKLDGVIGQRLFGLLDKMVIDARERTIPSNVSSFTLDGTVYVLYRIINQQVYVVGKHVVYEDSKLGLVEKIFQMLATHIQKNDASIELQLKNMLDLLEAFEYPKDLW